MVNEKVLSFFFIFFRFDNGHPMFRSDKSVDDQCMMIIEKFFLSSSFTAYLLGELEKMNCEFKNRKLLRRKKIRNFDIKKSNQDFVATFIYQFKFK